MLWLVSATSVIIFRLLVLYDTYSQGAMCFSVDPDLESEEGFGPSKPSQPPRPTRSAFPNSATPITTCRSGGVGGLPTCRTSPYACNLGLHTRLGMAVAYPHISPAFEFPWSAGRICTEQFHLLRSFLPDWGAACRSHPVTRRNLLLLLGLAIHGCCNT